MNTLIPWHLNFDPEDVNNGPVTDHDIKGALGFILDKMIGLDPKDDDLKRARLETRVAERLGDLRWVWRERTDSTLLGSYRFQALAYALGFEPTRPFIASMCEADFQLVLEALKVVDDDTLQYLEYDAELPESTIGKFLAPILLQHFSIETPLCDVPTLESIGIATDPPWEGLLAKDDTRWFTENAISAGFKTPKLEIENPSNDPCLNLENKHPTHSLMLANDELTISVTISPGNKTFITQKACAENAWTFSTVAPPPPPEPEVDVG